MKKKILGLLCLIMATLFTVSCTENAKMRELLKQIPANADVVFVGNVKAVVESAGGSLENSKIKIPSNIIDALPSSSVDAYDEANGFLKKSGIVLDACAIVNNYDANRPIIIFALSDPKQFVDAIERNGFREKRTEGDATFYTKKVYESSYSEEYDDYGYIAVNGSYAYWIEKVWVGSDFNALRYLENMIEDAKEKNFGETGFGDYIIDGNAGGLAIKWPKELKRELRRSGVSSDMLSIYDGTVCMRGNLSANKCTVDIKLFDEDGNDVSADIAKQYMDVSATIDGKALSMLGKDESMVYALSIKNFDWDKYAELLSNASGLSRSDRAQMNAILSYFEKIDGTVAVGFGLTDGLESIENMNRGDDVMQQFSTTMVIETKGNKTKQLVEDMKGFLEQSRIPFFETESGFSCDFRRFGIPGEIYVKNVNNFIVLANHPIKENNNNALIKSTDLTNYLFAFCVGMDKNNKLMRDLNIKNDIKFTMCCKPNTLESTMALEIDGDSNSGIIAKVAKIVLGVAANAEEIENRFRKSQNYYYYETDYDDEYVVEEAEEVYADSVYVEEEW